jgi:tRNA-(ms[2]io[6]A)-hydroxylase
MVSLKVATPPEWTSVALRDFDAFLLDHASCERKAAAVGMSFVVRYPDRTALIEPMIHFAREEMEHFHQVYRLIAERGLRLLPDVEDEYVNILMRHVRDGRETRFLDRLLISGVIEARGTERLHLIADAVTEPRLQNFYRRLARAEDSHKDLFVEMALQFFPAEVVEKRLDALLDIEAEAIQSVPFRSAVH